MNAYQQLKDRNIQMFRGMAIIAVVMIHTTPQVNGRVIYSIPDIRSAGMSSSAAPVPLFLVKSSEDGLD
jgi:surface polysaccharide O-acyltransferase-like enzyme